VAWLWCANSFGNIAGSNRRQPWLARLEFLKIIDRVELVVRGLVNQPPGWRWEYFFFVIIVIGGE
jgi:hypothetical protein